MDRKGALELDLETVGIEAPVDTAEGSSTDDLLSQLADGEINRLLAGAHSELLGSELSPASPRDHDHDEPPELVEVNQGSRPREMPLTADPVLDGELEEILATLPIIPVAGDEPAALQGQVTPEPPPAVGSGGSTTVPMDGASMVSPELDDAFEQMTAVAVPEAASNISEMADRERVVDSLDAIKVLDPIVAQEAAVGERSPVPDITPAAPPHDPLPETQTAITTPGSGRRPEYVLLLERVLSPLTWVSEPVRTAAGKLAILTLINAVAVLAYVLFFRRK